MVLKGAGEVVKKLKRLWCFVVGHRLATNSAVCLRCGMTMMEMVKHPQVPLRRTVKKLVQRVVCFFRGHEWKVVAGDTYRGVPGKAGWEQFTCRVEGFVCLRCDSVADKKTKEACMKRLEEIGKTYPIVGEQEWKGKRRRT